jgi:hypothetical protein
VQVIDLSEAASAADLRPNRLAAMLLAAQDFVRSFFDQVRDVNRVPLSIRKHPLASKHFQLLAVLVVVYARLPTAFYVAVVRHATGNVSNGLHGPCVQELELWLHVLLTALPRHCMNDVQNPLSQLGILAMRGGLCVRLTDMSASPEAQLRRLDVARIGR